MKIEELEEILNRGSETADTQNIVNDLMTQCLRDAGFVNFADELVLVDDLGNVEVIEELFNHFWDGASKLFINVVRSFENES